MTDLNVIQIWDGCYNQRNLKKDGYAIMTWPESQELMELKGFRENCWLINDRRGLTRFGSSAYVYSIDWYEKSARK
jgi:hypothetical protein